VVCKGDSETQKMNCTFALHVSCKAQSTIAACACAYIHVRARVKLAELDVAAGHRCCFEDLLDDASGARDDLWEAAHHESYATLHNTSQVTRHTSHVTRHTSHVTRHTSHVTRHAIPWSGCGACVRSYICQTSSTSLASQNHHLQTQNCSKHHTSSHKKNKRHSLQNVARHGTNLGSVMACNISSRITGYESSINFENHICVLSHHGKPLSP
jgi:hypothetical protein